MLFKVLKSDKSVIQYNSIPNENLSTLDAHTIISNHLDFNTIKINCNNGFLEYIAIPAFSNIELYFHETNLQIIFSNNLYELAKYLDKVNINENAVDFFLNMSYTPAGETIVNKLMRLIPSRVYQIKDGIFINEKIQYSSNIYSKDNSDYFNFTSCLEKICSKEADLGKVGVFFSGGVDSLSLALTLEKLEIPFTLYTGKMVQGLFDNEKDVLRSISIAKEKKWDLKVINVDYDDYEFSNLHKIIDLMPCTSHLSVIFLEIAKSMEKDGVKVSFSGQNVDILYNFEATTSLGLNRGAFVNFARRFFMSETYFSTLDSYSPKNFLVSIIARIFLLGYCLMRKSKNFRLPKSKDELFYNFTNNSDLTVFTSTNNTKITSNSKYSFTKGEGLRSALIRSRIEESLTSGAPKSIINAGIISNVKVVLPYSHELLIPFFMNLKTSVIDIFYPKKFIHQFVNANINNIKKHDLMPKDNLPNYHDWVEKIFPKTTLGKSLDTLDEDLNINVSTPALKLSYTISYNWKNYLIKTIEDKKNKKK
tara:strand:+ start:9803 stop:11407 length:1605 start_codon:yes stop_codon:yes gene_type:complete